MGASLPYEQPLPPVRGRHRDADLARRRRHYAAHLVMNGWTYQQVADHLGYANRGTVHRLVHDVLRRTSPAGVRELQELYFDRIEHLVSLYYDRAVGGDIKAARLLLGLLRDGASLMHLHDVTSQAEPELGNVIDPADLVRASLKNADARRTTSLPDRAPGTGSQTVPDMRT